MKKLRKSLSRGRGIYLLPNLFTTAALFAGFYGIIAGMHQRFELAAVAIFIAMLLDSLDGRVARLTNTQSAFGAEYDSLSDMVAFAVAPAIIAYSWGLASLGKLGWLAAFIYMAGTALRLARFNSMTEGVDKRYFYGLPCPSAAGVIVGMIWLSQELGIKGQQISFLALILTVSMGVLMVSNIRYRSFKDLDLKGKVPFFTVAIVVLLFVLIAIDPPQVLFFGFLLYALSGPILGIWYRRRRGNKEKKSTKDSQTDNAQALDDK